MQKNVIDQILEIEHKISVSDSRAYVLSQLRMLGLSHFGELLFSLPDPQYPKISTILPRMASHETQKNWTGNYGHPLLTQSVDFIRFASYSYSKIKGKSLENAKVLDFGCGCGRMARLMYYFIDEENYFGVDPWEKSIDLCKEADLNINFFQSEYLPTNLPIEDIKFDLIFAFSVFTHLSKKATIMAIKTLEKYLLDDGILIITIRPLEYWNVDPYASSLQVSNELIELHEKEGFAFLPHNRKAVDGDITYGDTSIALKWLGLHFPSLMVVGVDMSFYDPFQIYVTLKKV